MDNTLVRSHDGLYDISLPDIEAVNEMNAKGIRFIITTGRYGGSIITDMKKYGIWCDRITSSGSAVTIGDEVYLLGTIDPRVFEECFNKVTAVYPRLYSNFVVREKDNYRYNTLETVDYTNDSFLENIRKHHQGINKFQFRFGSVEEMEGTRKIVASITDEIEGHSSSPFNADYSARGVNKGAAIRFVLDHFGLSREEAAGIGDGENDITIMENTAMNFAMENSDRELQAHCQHVVSSIREMYDIIREYNEREAVR